MTTAAACKVADRLRALVHLDALLPRMGEDEIDLWPREGAHAARDELARNPAATRAPLSARLLGITEAEEARWVDARMRPQPLATYAQRIERDPGLPGGFIHCTEPSPLVPRFRAMAERARALGWPVVEVRTGHPATMTAPRDVAAALEDFARRPGGH